MRKKKVRKRKKVGERLRKKVKEREKEDFLSEGRCVSFVNVPVQLQSPAF